MRWVKSFLSGMTAAILSLIVTVLATTRWHFDGGAGSGGIGAVSYAFFDVMLLIPIIAFALGFWLQMRRSRSRAAGQGA